jgi:hypothetical protein
VFFAGSTLQTHNERMGSSPRGALVLVDLSKFPADLRVDPDLYPRFIVLRTQGEFTSNSGRVCQLLLPTAAKPYRILPATRSKTTLGLYYETQLPVASDQTLLFAPLSNPAPLISVDLEGALAIKIGTTMFRVHTPDLARAGISSWDRLIPEE